MPSKAGFIRMPDDNRHLRPFVDWREIRRGKRRGMIEVTVGKGPKKVVVDPAKVHRWPEKTAGHEITQGRLI